MARVGAFSGDQSYQYCRHKMAVQRKQEKIGVLQALLEMWEKKEDWDEVRAVTKRLRIAQCQLKAMKP